MVEMEDIKREYEKMIKPNKVEIRFSLAKHESGFYLPDVNGEFELVACFRSLTFDDHNTVYSMTTKLIQDEKAKDYITQTDYLLMKKLILKRQLISWNIDIDIEYDGEWIKDDCFERICSLPGPILMKLLDKYEEVSNVTVEEEEIMKRQSSLLFSNSASGVSSPCEAVTLYCNLGRFWEKFGLNKFDLKNLSYREYLMLRMMSLNEDEVQRRASKAAHTTSNTRVAWKGW